MKPKSQIPWNNYIMRKHGKSIRKAIEQIGINQNAAILSNKTLKAMKDKKPLWISNEIGTC